MRIILYLVAAANFVYAGRMVETGHPWWICAIGGSMTIGFLVLIDANKESAIRQRYVNRVRHDLLAGSKAVFESIRANRFLMALVEVEIEKATEEYVQRLLGILK